MCEWACTSGAVHRTLILISSTEIISYSVHRTIVLVGYGTGTVPGTNGLIMQFEQDRQDDGEVVDSFTLASQGTCSGNVDPDCLALLFDLDAVHNNDPSLDLMEMMTLFVTSMCILLIFMHPQHRHAQARTATM